MEEDYKKLYLEQKKQSFMLEMSLMQLRADTINKELPEIEKQLKKYVTEGEVPGTDET